MSEQSTYNYHSLNDYVQVKKKTYLFWRRYLQVHFCSCQCAVVTEAQILSKEPMSCVWMSLQYSISLQEKTQRTMFLARFYVALTFWTAMSPLSHVFYFYCILLLLCFSVADNASHRYITESLGIVCLLLKGSWDGLQHSVTLNKIHGVENRWMDTHLHVKKISSLIFIFISFFFFFRFEWFVLPTMLGLSFLVSSLLLSVDWPIYEGTIWSFSSTTTFGPSLHW